MIAKVRNLNRQFPQKYRSNFKNLLVSGCSYVWNNSSECSVTWPYYLRDIAGFEEVYDCSQSGGGPSHVFNSIINEIETNENLDPANTLIIIMWPQLSRVDTIARQDITRPWHSISNYNFNETYGTLSLFLQNDDNSSLSQLCREYHKHVDGSVYENMIKVAALNSYLRDKNFTKVFLSWKSPLSTELIKYLDPIEHLDDFTQLNRMRVPNDGHPTPDAHLRWTREHLIPYLNDKNFIETVK